MLRILQREPAVGGAHREEVRHRVIGVRAGEIVYDGKMEDTPQSVFDNIYNGGKGKEED